jgi:hypothetical protein
MLGSKACDLAPQIRILQTVAEDIDEVIIPSDHPPGGADGKSLGSPVIKAMSQLSAIHPGGAAWGSSS